MATRNAVADAGAWVSELHTRGRAWVGGMRGPATARTAGYLDLLFAFGLARLGQADRARQLLAGARDALAGQGGLHLLVAEAFSYRIQQALDGAPAGGTLPAELLERLAQASPLDQFPVDQLRLRLRILEPFQRINPYRHWAARLGDLDEAVGGLAGLADRGAYDAAVRALLEQADSQPQAPLRRMRILEAALDRADLAGRELTEEWLRLALSALNDEPAGEPDDRHNFYRCRLAWRAADAASALGAAECFLAAADAARRYVADRAEQPRAPGLGGDELIATLVRAHFRLGLREEAERFLDETSALLLRGRSVAEWSQDGEADPLVLVCLLGLAEGWNCLGEGQRAAAVISGARSQVERDPAAKGAARLLCASVAAISTARREDADSHFDWLFGQVPELPNQSVTCSHYHLPALQVADSVVLAAL